MANPNADANPKHNPNPIPKYPVKKQKNIEDNNEDEEYSSDSAKKDPSMLPQELFSEQVNPNPSLDVTYPQP
jgi:hypothetical protein